MKNRPKTLELLIKRGSKIDYNKRDFGDKYRNKINGFIYASEKGSIFIIELLLSFPVEYGIDASADNNFALCFASNNG